MELNIFQKVLIEDGCTSDFLVDLMPISEGQKIFVMDEYFMAEEQTVYQHGVVNVPTYEVRALGNTPKNALENLQTKIDKISLQFLLDCIIKAKRDFVFGPPKTQFNDSLIMVTRDREVPIMRLPSGYCAFTDIGLAVLNSKALSGVKLE